ncbi:GNAT family N-acetyltransferase [Alteromonas ponticola]|uniref:GNAT family N-acetyltransferase n=1 Tax=Alteromonas aquimaris TaxID=2998417 RepID=A0ABT3PAJ5_9ALTE|nr:GNAT family N-acetyltransferase [Alteromonas aquimaris]MCW8109729.1 GNAT family N-acetyltransferase [Alteromonas aquimaris]
MTTIEYRRCKDLSTSADITYRNMRPYYEYHSVNWDQDTILGAISSLENWDIIVQGQVIGALRLAFDVEGCYLRDLQVCEDFQNKGIGAKSLQQSKNLALQSGAAKLRLRVMKISPAFKLYKREGFAVTAEDEKFYYMEQSLKEESV